ncbi:MAG: glycoside hydrolase family 19 protein [Flavobacterium nitrogenifigens]|uniref:Putative chitinase n=1 Tax=Flavobacterium nitrogenifigens TaxID=1617283 RepID=A0A521AEP1_9FLAO|nr:glycoside hydrolase family 19 protein [Flavobacterium nitrogenifigens]KAF2331478.1 glycoside hydrolase family 19 protein [Flavobacterium nitrogenifigens]MDQ8012954.1 glycoside hydrolase family 19 protein [Flavobacterium nitrogenifigens]SMO33273.1 putative chitinase [Flavobacterium nitrogenifigens]
MNELIQQLNTKYNTILNQYGLDTQLRRVHFWSQLYHESKLVPRAENLSYSAERLLKIFPKYFKDLETAKKYEHQPEKIANYVYANHNGNTESSDGWHYRGRGFIQLTGRNNYEAFSKHLNNDKILSEPELLLTEVNALVSALWYWKMNKINSVIDNNNELSIQRVTRKINGGTTGIAQRIVLFHEVSKLKLL